MSRAKRLVAIVSLPLAGSGAGDLLAVPAFSGAEGWGAITPGGRGGAVLHVTNLNDSGPGSFRAAVAAAGPRTVVFDVAGQINLLSEVSVTNPYLTIAGHTAPGAGVTIGGETTSLETHEIAIRYLRFRRGNTTRADDALGSDRTTGNIIIDHVSASWGLDENMSVYRNKLDAPITPGGSTVLPTRNVTIQWSISSEALNPNSHAFGSTLGGAGVNFHHNLWASNTGRNPSISFSHFMDFRNNVLFNWQHRSVDGAGPEAHVNMVNNYYKSGPATNAGQLKYRIVKPELRNGVVGYGEAGWWYVEGNYVNGFGTITSNNWNGGVQFDLAGMQQAWVRSLTPHTHVTFPDDPDDPNDDVNGVPIPIPDLPIVATQTPLDAYNSVLAGAGATLPARDAVDVRVANSVSTGVATAGPGGNGIINSPADVGGYPAIAFVQRPADWDTDQDGMPNAWETTYGLNPNDAADRNGDFDTDGFSNLDEYLNELGAFAAIKPVVWTGGTGRYALIGNWDIAFQPSRFDTAQITSGHATVDAVGQDAGALQVGGGGSLAQLTIASGRLNVATSTVVGINGRINYNGGAFNTPSLSLIDGGVTLLSAGGNKVLRTGALVIETADNSKLDLNDSDAILTATPKSVVESYVASASIMSTAAVANGATGLGVLSGAEYAALNSNATTFDGYSIAPSDVLVKYTWDGDTNLNGVVNFDDYVRIDGGFNLHLTGWSNGDFNYSGAVDFDDYVLIDIAFNSQNGTLGRAVRYLTGEDRSESGRAEIGVREVIEHFEQLGIEYAQYFLAAVPEPACAGGLVGLAAIHTLRRRRRTGCPRRQYLWGYRRSDIRSERGLPMTCHEVAKGLETMVAASLITATAVSAQTTRTPIDDLGAGLYLGQYQGGLYPGGSNTIPAVHEAAGAARSSNILPLNTAGQADANGKFVFLSVGMSNTSQEWCGNDSSLVYQPYSLMGQAAVHPAVDHTSMVLFNGARGGQTAGTWDSTSDANYARVQSDLTAAGLSELQVRAAWLKVANAQPQTSLPAASADANVLVQQMGNIVRSMKTRYPNLEMVFVSSRIYAGYATSALNPEPYAYESGFAVKRLIGGQINQMNGGGIDPLAGDLNDGNGGVAPWIGWGPYLWADGANPRGSDGLTWLPTDFNADGTHPNSAGREKVATLLMRSFINSPLSRDWFLRYRQGDANLNGGINFDDYVRVDHGFNLHLTGWTNGDFNYSGAVDFDDYVLIDVAFNTQEGTLARAVGYLSGEDHLGYGSGVQIVAEHARQFGPEYVQHFLAAVPEPVLLGAGFAVAAGLRRTRRRAYASAPVHEAS